MCKKKLKKKTVGRKRLKIGSTPCRQTESKLAVKRSKTPKTMEELYLHISNSGVTFGVEDHGLGPVVHIHGGAFGHTLGEMKIHAPREVLAKLGEMFTKSSKRRYSPEYCCTTRIPDKGKRCSGNKP